jgi:dihydrolipoamide dehydrogenase
VIDQVDCLVIGAGPGGYVAAIRAAQLGMRTAIVEREASLGGRCLHWACIPAKTVLRSADALSEIRLAAELGIDAGHPSVSFTKIADRRRQVIGTLESGIRALLAKNGIEIVIGEASIDADRTVRVGERTLQAGTALVLATGSVGQAPPGIDFGPRVIGTEQAWAFDALPTSIAVLGAGASGAEIASAYARLGTRTSLFEHAERVLPTEDPDISSAVVRGLREQGIDVFTSARVREVRELGDRVALRGGEDDIQAEWLVLATGRTPDTDHLGLERAGVSRSDSGHVQVDRYQRTSAEGVYAIGDLVAGPALAHKASEEGIIAVETAAGRSPTPLDHSDIPRATFCAPNVASFGLTEGAARAAGHDVSVGKVSYSAVGAAAVFGDRRGLVKIVGDRTYGTILGAHIVGSRAPDLIQQLVTAKHLEGGYNDIARIVHGHPTLSESVLEAARAADGWLIHG